ncbi:MAG: taurine dioxygenase [Gammaproteobacteria bacterium]|jgi:taurine dioxygenase
MSAYQHIEVHRAGSALGAEIRGVSLAEPIPQPAFDEIYRAWLEHHVVFFRDQQITPAQQLEFGQRIGGIHIHPFNKGLDDHPEVLEILKTENQQANNGGRWHSDQMYTPKPAKATMLVARETPPHGGDTQFSNLHLSYEALSPSMQNLLAGLKGVNNGDSRKYHKLTRAERASSGVGTMPQKEQPEDVPTISVHPIIRTHPETGRKALYFGSHTERFEDMTEAESDSLLKFLTAHATRPEFVYRHRWETGTVTLWDNRCLQHFAVNDYQGHRRCMHKITIAGDDKPH